MMDREEDRVLDAISSIWSDMTDVQRGHLVGYTEGYADGKEERERKAS